MAVATVEPGTDAKLPVCECQGSAKALTTNDTIACVSNTSKWEDRTCTKATSDGSCSIDAGLRPCSFPGRERILWLHFPKCATSFGTALLHLASTSLPDKIVVPNMFNTRAMNHLRDIHDLRRPIFWLPPGGFGWHATLTEDYYEGFFGRVFAMFREPAARLVSSYNDLMGQSYRAVLPLKEYAVLAAGGVARMVNGIERNADGLYCQVWDADGAKSVAKEQFQGSRSELHTLYQGKRRTCPALTNASRAIVRMHTFAFVGLLEQWDLSICLLHARFGGRCVGAEFGNNRRAEDARVDVWGAAGRRRNKTDFAIQRASLVNASTVLDSARSWLHPSDPDVPLYDAARRRFERDVEAAGLSEERCKQLCPAFGTAVAVPAQLVRGVRGG